MIKHRNSHDHLHSAVILSKITEYDIFRHYCPNFKELGVKFCSDLREDTRPGVSIVEWKGGLLYKDFANEEHTFNCFGYVMYKYSLEFVGVMQLISQDFGLGLASSNVIPTAKKYVYNKTPLKRSVIRIKARHWNSLDADYWKQFCIPRNLLVKFDVHPIKYFWINETRFHPHSISYAFRFSNGYKIYSPYEEDNKWYSNVGKDVVQGYFQLVDRGEIVFLTSSLKDVMCLEVLGYPAIALQSEMQLPGETLIKTLKERFKEVIVFYDNDFGSEQNPGQTVASKICSKFGLANVYVPDIYCSKDISDLIKNRGLNEAQQLINKEIWQLTNKSKSTRSYIDAPF
tara:strand:+ start:345 stop:1373 length:1029 start_codon:yes stop_codon:yes gene_type:complete